MDDFDNQAELDEQDMADLAELSQPNYSKY